jgi:large-conductance mechanosensitive channel
MERHGASAGSSHLSGGMTDARGNGFISYLDSKNVISVAMGVLVGATLNQFVTSFSDNIVAESIRANIPDGMGAGLRFRVGKASVSAIDTLVDFGTFVFALIFSFAALVASERYLGWT